MSTKGPVHLIDFDGVLVRNSFLDRLVREKATRFLQHQLQCSPETAAFLNTTLTPLVGHTTLVLCTAPPPKKLVHRYNRFVYDAHTMFSVKPCVEICEPRDRRRVRRLTPEATYKTKALLCTSAPSYYCDEVFKSLAIPLSEICDPNVRFTSDTGLVKPTDAFWDSVETTSLTENRDLVLIDDNVLNVQAVLARGPEWSRSTVVPNGDPAIVRSLLEKS